MRASLICDQRLTVAIPQVTSTIVAAAEVGNVLPLVQLVPTAGLHPPLANEATALVVSLQSSPANGALSLYACKPASEPGGGHWLYLGAQSTMDVGTTWTSSATPPPILLQASVHE
jgi:hypothetical protein